ncbi:hypothetical protein FIBSPDRAFT_874478 [Athelia psychrophila]|uniref:Uncharacterized protein n=1 Tax=Athelia psychrophila TaxID=1759441 RepID=A0A165XHA3_9AGAM|nr:hypothetical protein FIBSPDRAFT_874478 [Fibularhizoctonia sp. CBS 109695]
MTVLQLPRLQLHISHIPINEFVSHRTHQGSRHPFTTIIIYRSYTPASLERRRAYAPGRVCAGVSYPAR